MADNPFETGGDRPAGCKGCGATVRLAPGEAERIVSQYLQTHPTAKLADDATCTRRLAICTSCPDLRYGTTCRHCGCLVAVRARLADQPCPAPVPLWS